MLKELRQQVYSFPFGSAEIRLRYDLSALLALELAGFNWKDIFGEEISRSELTAFLLAGCRDDIGVERASGILNALGCFPVWEHCKAAMTLALPKPDPTLIPQPNSGGEVDFGKLRTLICDVMGKPEEFFWNSTLAELAERWQAYGIAKGYVKPPERMELYDTEGI